MKKDEKCFYCDGKGKIRYLEDGEECTCTVCNGSGINIKAVYQKKHLGKNKCKYCGRLCSGYACKSCLDAFESDREVEE